MDLIQQELMKKRETLSSQTGGKRFFKRSEIEKNEIKKLREEERREIEAKTLRQISAVDSSTPASKSTASKTSSASAATSSSPALTNEQNIDNLDLPKSEVVRRLRFLKQPATLFGEDEPARLERLKHVLRTGAFEVDSDMTEGQTNDFLRDIAELRKRQKTGSSGSGTKRQKRGSGSGNGNGGGGGGGGSEDGEGDEDNGASSGADVEKDLKRMRTDFGELCDEDKILVFFKKLLNEWKQELDEMPDAGKRTANGRSMVANFKQCARYLHPLFKFCRKKILPADIRRALLIMVDYCMKRDYLAAMDHYIKMAIGNAPWPIGVTMVGIHERSAREKIYTNSVAHIMNDETTRKYLQSVKRLMTYCQRRYPTMPSKAVEFNSLANGSDLQSLLAEERGFAGNQAPGERLRLMPAPNEE